MAIGQRFLKVTKTTNVVSVTGGAGNTTIDIDGANFRAPSQTASSPTVGIKEIYWSGDVTVESASTGTFRFDSGNVSSSGHFILPALEATDSDEDIKVTLGTGGGTCILVLRKLTGYAGI
tara:strand:+ start:115 stop:474 length:360 start_codon:yes stop_codon:yes gene_type:complete